MMQIPGPPGKKKETNPLPGPPSQLLSKSNSSSSNALPPPPPLPSSSPGQDDKEKTDTTPPPPPPNPPGSESDSDKSLVPPPPPPLLEPSIQQGKKTVSLSHFHGNVHCLGHLSSLFVCEVFFLLSYIFMVQYCMYHYFHSLYIVSLRRTGSLTICRLKSRASRGN